jgi:hypothetical protein
VIGGDRAVGGRPRHRRDRSAQGLAAITTPPNVDIHGDLTSA